MGYFITMGCKKMEYFIIMGYKEISLGKQYGLHDCFKIPSIKRISEAKYVSHGDSKELLLIIYIW